jgi:hypothetical protein
VEVVSDDLKYRSEAIRNLDIGDGMTEKPGHAFHLAAIACAVLAVEEQLETLNEFVIANRDRR